MFVEAIAIVGTELIPIVYAVALFPPAPSPPIPPSAPASPPLPPSLSANAV